MGFRSRARARREQMNVLPSNRDVSKKVDNDVLASSENENENTILGVVEPVVDTPAVAGPDADEVKAKDVPQGTSNELKEWVGENVNRARVAYEVEKGSDKPRKTLMTHLEGMLGDNDDE